MQMHNVLLAAFALPALLLAGCGGGGSNETAEAASDAEIAGSVAGALAGSATGLVDSSGLPDFVEIYAGGTPVMNMKTKDGNSSGGLFSYTTKAPIADVVEFYRKSAKRNGIEFSSEASTQDGMTIGGSNADKSKSMFIMIGRGGGEEGDEISVSIQHNVKTG